MGEVQCGQRASLYNPASALSLSQMLLTNKSFACLIPSLNFFMGNPTCNSLYNVFIIFFSNKK